MASRLLFPSIYLLTTHLTAEELGRLQAQIPSLSRDARKAEVILGRISRKERAKFELRRLGIVTEEVRHATKAAGRKRPNETEDLATTLKWRRTHESQVSPARGEEDSTASEPSEGEEEPSEGEEERPRASASSTPTVTVVKLAWFERSMAANKVLPLDAYLLYEGRIVPFGEEPLSSPRTASGSAADASQGSVSSMVQSNPGSPLPKMHARRPPRAAHPSLVRRNTSEEKSVDLPPVPANLHTTYSCQRSTPSHPPNAVFIAILKQIRSIRELTGDHTGYRAYSTAIASLSAYPHVLSTTAEVSRLPGCGPKIAELFREYNYTGGYVHEAEEAATDPELKALRIFCNICGVAEVTAHAFYKRGWRDVDDVVEHGWRELTRVQQIGVKFYDEFLQPMTRAQVETVAATVLAFAQKIAPGFQMVIAGGYRRGKELSGDADILLSHPDEAVTHQAIGRLVDVLEKEGRITHVLTKSEGEQEDTLDKALVVWQEPVGKKEENTKNEADDDEPESEDEKGHSDKDGSGKNVSHHHHHPNPNPNLHRRVDIIISPWRTVGCAVLGWSGGTTFQRDLRRYCKKERGLRFDSSGTRQQSDGSWVDLEDFATDPAPDMLVAERRVFAALDLEWRPPEERCTG